MLKKLLLAIFVRMLVGSTRLAAPASMGSTGDGSGLMWSVHEVPDRMAWAGLAVGNGMFVAVAYPGDGTSKIMSSLDGMTWTPSDNPDGPPPAPAPAPAPQPVPAPEAPTQTAPAPAAAPALEHLGKSVG